MSKQVQTGNSSIKSETVNSPESGCEQSKGELRQSINSNSMQTVAWTDFGDDDSHVDHFVHAFLATSLIDGDPEAVDRSIERKQHVMSRLDDQTTLKLAHLILDASDIRVDDPAVQVLLSDHTTRSQPAEQKLPAKTDFSQIEQGITILAQAIEPQQFSALADIDQSARCVDADPEAFFPDKGESTKEAKRICSDCPVKQPCLDFALANDEKFGIWGGLSPKERRRLKKLDERTTAA